MRVIDLPNLALYITILFGLSLSQHVFAFPADSTRPSTSVIAPRDDNIFSFRVYADRLCSKDQKVGIHQVGNESSIRVKKTELRSFYVEYIKVDNCTIRVYQHENTKKVKASHTYHFSKTENDKTRVTGSCLITGNFKGTDVHRALSIRAVCGPDYDIQRLLDSDNDDFDRDKDPKKKKNLRKGPGKAGKIGKSLRIGLRVLEFLEIFGRILMSFF